MKRFLSWLVLCVLSYVFYYVEYWFWELVFLLGNVIYRFSEALFWVLIVCEGVTALGIVILLIVAGSRGVISASQAVWRSKAGTRYKLLGGFLIAMNLGFFVALLVLGGGIVSNPMIMAIALLTMIAFGIALLISGFTVVEEYGPPKTEREILEEKLRRLDEKEAQNGQNT